jgi:gamma-glutamylcyclotransferase (GGCT)/AIG2-like uncharacterized protein YtfP
MAEDASGRPNYLFVYGTLMQAYDHPMARLLSEQAERLGEGSCCGQLFRIKHYPGLIASNDARDRVFGELFRLRETKRLLAKLDDYEGCGPSAPQPTLYIRVTRPITLPDRTVDAWVYLYNRPVSGLPRILSGRFLAP